ncbi:TRAP transporter 4TM/12TM fusion protein [Bradyrhizobium japonicum]|jgi:TRAP transporter 4TM/12TM fusion protein|uniref:TRAP transporter 4TM/12TM fusion protein n=1 Tax=Bradyrhizobium elkanii TaxID=29448 RepID=A0ABV4ES00_BRAEL|nr:TRAP transporter permease [Bradyrhizobium elkanii]MBP2429639.1 TRAP transporter 4TM/12TM fusion protein [Bradyrhizobium elkanii]MCP1736890.1 TRAP transporter 4TM/12TM fusion protein [Bradyrhizobium elkanii]MCP1754935.1 TRAP transporter 4TM/12TM fusion protein [Bradyrhizobium elkanii]MCP1980453.1 TRAP transporter 4TM/12TM fusion protein [Bradyrhizobium elkanii]MCS3572230.1 TRAP transporter 4TM/12TM fusion protein [Bradyrhizobium elkanii]
MQQQAEGEQPIKVEFDNFEHGFPEGFGPGAWGYLAYAIGLAFAVFQLYVAAFNYLPSQVVRGVHVGFLILLTFGLIGNFTAKTDFGRAVSWIVGAAGFLCGLYQWIFYADLIARDGDPTNMDLAVGTLLAVLIFEGTRRLMGAALPLMCGACLLYWFFGQYLPSPFNHRGYDFDQIVTHLSFGTEGFYGVPIYVSATYIFLFILFGSFLERAGMIQLFTDVSLGLFGRTRGGPAKVAVFASGMMGTISGSGVANVVTVGQFTIPLMIKFGYRRAFAAGVEATASMGGQIMPPVMGAVAFIMAETLGVPYSEIVKAAVIPAVLYFASAFWMVHLEAGKHGLVGMKRAEIPSAWKALVARWYLVLPLAALVYMLFEGFTPLYAGSMGLALTVALILGASITLGFSNTVLRYIFWIGLALVVAAVSRHGIEIVPVAGVVAGLIVIAAITRGGRATLKACRDSLADSAKSALTVGMACAIVGTIIGMMTQTGVGTIFGSWIIGLGAKSLFLALIMTMLLSILLGTGIPTIPTYIITAALAAPALAKLGVPLIASHMFAFYYGIMADLSPPVALAALAAAPIAKENPDKIGWEAMRIALAGYVIPFIFVYSPALMLQAGDPMQAQLGFYGAVALAAFKALVAIGLFGIVAIGFLFTRLTFIEILVAFGAALCLLGDFPFSDTAGFTLAAAVVLWQWRQRPRNAVAAA